ncbi:hypothetical protein Tco_0112419 [Tanacetum coccineum]
MAVYQCFIKEYRSYTHDSDEVQGTDTLQGTAAYQGTASIPKSPSDYTPTDASQTSGGDEGLLDIYALNREVKRLKRQTLSQAKQIIKLKVKLKKLSKFVQPVVQHHAFWVENQNLKKQKRRRKKHKKKVSSVKLGRNKDEGTLSEEHRIRMKELCLKSTMFKKKIQHILSLMILLIKMLLLLLIWETTESSDDDFWKDQEEWEIIRWRFHESSGVHTLEIEDGQPLL